MSQRRPFGITVLAVLDYLLAACVFLLAVSCFLPTRARSAVFGVFDWLARPDIPSFQTSWTPFTIGLLSLLIALLHFLLANGLWKVRNWARIITIIFSLSDLVSGKLPSMFGFLNMIVPSPWTGLAGYVLSFLLLLYLISPTVRTAFGITTTRNKWLVPAVSALALACLTYGVYESKPELQAIRWHRHHGDRIQVNGVSFPVYAWYTPLQERDGAGFRIRDRPGPLREGDDIGAYIAVKPYGEVEKGGSVEQRLDDQMQGYHRAGYDRPGFEVSRFQLRAANETLGCLSTRVLVTRIDCYGDGPIAYVFFSGGDRSFDRFQHMMRAAR